MEARKTLSKDPPFVQGDDKMKIKWLGHASFLITSSNGTKIITDPYPDGIVAAFMGIRYPKIKETADIVTISHNHPDHNNVGAIRGKPKVLRSSGTREVDGIVFNSVTGSHGRFRGPTKVFKFTVDGINLCHPGDLVRLLRPDQLKELGEIDVLFLPVIGIPFVGKITANAARPSLVCEQLHPKVIIPMHFRNLQCWMPFPTIDDFLRRGDGLPHKKLDTCEIELSKDTLPSNPQIIVLRSAKPRTANGSNHQSSRSNQVPN